MPFRKVSKKTRVTRRVKKSVPKKFGYVKQSGNLLKDVKMLKRMVKRTKPEVKQITPLASSDLVGQVDGNGGGASGFIINHSCGAGVGSYGARIGEEIRLIGINLRMQFQQQTAAAIASNYIVNVVRYSDPTASIATVINRTFSNDTISGVVDTNSTRNRLYLSDYKIIASRKVYMPADFLSNVSNLKDLKMLVKQRTTLKYNGTSTAEPVNWQYAVIIRASTGNKSGTTASTNTNVGQTAVSTGCKFHFVTKSYFTDI